VASILEKVLRVGEGRVLRRLENYAKAINALEDDFRQLTDEELKNETVQLRERYSNGESLDDLLPEAFAAVREASTRTLGLRHFDVQLMGGAALHLGNIAEMKPERAAGIDRKTRTRLTGQLVGNPSVVEGFETRMEGRFRAGASPPVRRAGHPEETPAADGPGATRSDRRGPIRTLGHVENDRQVTDSAPRSRVPGRRNRETGDRGWSIGRTRSADAERHGGRGRLPRGRPAAR
jgi:hypothetical protein